MKIAMGPPPPKNPSFSNSNSSIEDTSNPSTTTTTTTKKPMGPPPPIFATLPPPESDLIHNEETKTSITDEIATTLDNTHVVESKLEEEEEQQQQQQQETFQEPKPKPKPKSIPDSITKESPSITIPYSIPPWSDAPCHPFSLEVLKDGSIIDQFEVSEKGAYMFGRVDLCDFVLDHPTISRFHAVMQFKQSGEAYIYDLGSTHGTSVNKKEVKKKVYTELHVGDVIRFGHSSRLYVFQGPTELMPPEGDLRKIRNVKIREEMHDREASLLRAKQEASIASGISWGMAEDAIEEAEDDAEEVTWQTYKGQLTDRQQKTREKVIKRIEKVANMKKEIDAIRVKDIPQGGLTQGQQTQIARNEQRMAQILEELESLEETLNESIQESLGARGGKVRSKKKGAVMEDEDEAPSDDDEFYDRTKKPATQKVGELQSIETADSLLDKKDAIMKEMENKRTLIVEKNRTVPEIESGTEDGDPLDAYMTGLSSQIVLDSTMQLQNDLSSLQSELDRILYLLRIADPSGEAARKRELRVNEPNSSETAVSTSDSKHLPAERKRRSGSTKLTDDSSPKGGPASITQNAEVLKVDKTVIVSNEHKPPVVISVAAKVAEVDSTVTESTESKTPVYTVTKPQWLGAIHDTEMKEVQNQDASLDTNNSDQFVDYKDRKEILGSAANGQVELGVIGEASGLIIRKRKQIEKPKGSDKTPEVSTSSGEAETTAADAVALLLKHKRGVSITDEEEQNASLGVGTQAQNDNKKTRRVLGPEKPAFLKSNPDYEAWVPPKDQSGDGRTSLNDRFGY